MSFSFSKNHQDEGQQRKLEKASKLHRKASAKSNGYPELPSAEQIDAPEQKMISGGGGLGGAATDWDGEV